MQDETMWFWFLPGTINPDLYPYNHHNFLTLSYLTHECPVPLELLNYAAFLDRMYTNFKRPKVPSVSLEDFVRYGYTQK